RVVRRADGVERHVSVRAALVGDEDGEAVVLQGSLQDVTEQRAAEQALAAARAREEAAQREHSIAEELQRSLLPADTFDLEHLDVATFYRAGVEGTYVGGDWYDIIELADGRTAFVMGDVMGRGVRAASVMGQLRSAARAYASLDLSPHEVLTHLDKLVEELSGDQIVTCVYGIFDPAEETLCYANAGHLPPLLVGREGIVRRLTEGGPPLGTGYADGRSEPVAVDTGSLIVFYTDGLVEHRGENIDDGIRRLERELDRRGRESIVGLPEAVVDALLPDGPDDDVAILMARVGPADLVATLSMLREGVTLSVADARAFVMSQLDAWDVPEDVVRDLALVSSELVTNALVHGGDHVRLRLERTGARVVVLVDDDAEERLPTSRDPSDDDESGRGLHIVEALSDEWGIRPTGRGKSIWSARTWRSTEGDGR
ncbi:MAG: PAS sensor protein, partial [Actinomycetales bacterium]